MATTSGLYALSTTRDGIITRALRIIGAIGQGETPTATAITEASEALNDLEIGRASCRERVSTWV